MTGVVAACTACGAPLVSGQQFCTRCGAEAQVSDPLRDRLQELLGAELQVLDVVGRGGMAVVYAARDPLLERRVAVKAMLPEFAADKEMADRFLREARTAAQLQHPNIVSVFGARSRGDLLVMLMAFVEGRSLDKVIAEKGPLPLPIVGRLAADVASALQYAHEHKVIHRDVKPGNVLLASNGGALVSDFGIARRQDVPGMTGEGMLLGSLSYMSPEQRYGESLTGATDQYALAVSVFEMLTGRGPFTGPPIDQHIAHLNQAPPSVRTLRADVPESVANALLRMMAKSPADRFPDLREPKRVFEKMVTDARSVSAEIAMLSGVLQAATPSRVLSAVRKAPTLAVTNVPAPRAAGDVTPAKSDATSAPTVITTATPRAPSKMPIYAAVAAAVVIIGGAIVLKGRMNTSAPSAPAVTPPSTVEQAGAAGAAPASVAPTGAAAVPNAAPAVASSRTTAPPGAAPASQGVPLPAASLSRPQEAPASSASATAAPTAPAAVEPSKPATPPAALADARAAARAFVTLLNQRRVRDVERLGDAGEGEAAARRELEKSARDGNDFAAGFASMATTPEMDGASFITEFGLDAQWKSGGKDVGAVYDVRLRVARQGEAWVVVAYSVKGR